MKTFLTRFFFYDFFPLIYEAMRETNTSSGCIDHIWFNKYNVTLAGSITADVSDHYPNLL